MKRSQAALLKSVKAQLAAFPRVSLASLPTPLERLANLSRELGVNLYIKRDDQTGLGMGGNKTRKLEFIIADALAQGADSIVTWAGVQSNWCRQLAAAARRAGIEPFLVLFKRPGLPRERDGNLLLDEILGANITTFEIERGLPIGELTGVEDFVRAAMEQAKQGGRKPYLAPIGGSRLEGSMRQPWGAMGYVNAVVELAEQAEAIGVTIDHLVFATSSGGTHAGLLAGARLLGAKLSVVGISVSGKREEIARIVSEIGSRTLAEFHGRKVCREIGEVTAFDGYVGEGYGLLNDRVVQAIRLVAEKEGILLDPVYTGKAMAGLLDLAAKGYFRPGQNVAFLHTGGTPALFPYGHEILDYLGRGEK